MDSTSRLFTVDPHDALQITVVKKNSCWIDCQSHCPLPTPIRITLLMKIPLTYHEHPSKIRLRSHSKSMKCVSFLLYINPIFWSQWIKSHAPLTNTINYIPSHHYFLVMNAGNGWEWGLLGLSFIVDWIIPSFPTWRIIPLSSNLGDRKSPFRIGLSNIYQWVN